MIMKEFEIQIKAYYQFALKYIEQIRLGKSVSFENCSDNGAEKSWIEANYAPLTDANGRVTSFSVLNFDITERKQNDMINSIQNRISEIFLLNNDNEMFNEVLEVLLEVMKSPFGFLGYIDIDGDFVIPVMTRQMWEDCAIPNKTFRVPVGEWENSAWSRALHEKKTLCSNEPTCNLPEGQVKIQRHIG